MLRPMENQPDPGAHTIEGGQTGPAPIEIKVHYECVNAFFSDYIKNIKDGWIFIKTDRPLKIGTILAFSVIISAGSASFTLQGLVAWVREADSPPSEIPAGAAAGSPSVPGMGIRFLYRDDAEQRGFEHAVEAMMKDALGDHVFSRLMERNGAADAGVELKPTRS